MKQIFLIILSAMLLGCACAEADELKSRDLTPADVFVLTVDDAGKVTCVKKEDACGRILLFV